MDWERTEASADAERLRWGPTTITTVSHGSNWGALTGTPAAKAWRRVASAWAQGWPRFVTPGRGSGDRHVFAEIDVLDRVEELDALFHRLLERLAA